MKPEELAEILRRMIADPPDTRVTTTLNLFGIRYAEYIGNSANRIAEMAGAGAAAGSDIRRGKRLAPYVTLNVAGRRAVR